MEARDVFLIHNDLVRTQLERICSDLTDEQVRYGHEAVDERGISAIVTHLYGAIANRARLLLGQEREPAPTELPATTASLLAYIEQTHARARELIERISPAQLEASYVPYANREMSGAQAMADAFAHAFRHVGNILDTRHLGGFETHALG